MAGNLTGQVRNIAEVTTAVANGDLSKKITVDVKGEILELKNTINTMVDQLELVRRGSHARRARSRHRRKAGRPGRSARRRRHVWKDLTDNVNFMAGNLTAQVRNIAEVVTAVANGDLSQKITVDVQGRDPSAEVHHQHHGRQLSSSPSEVTRVAREVGTEGKLGGQARGPGRRRHLEGSHRQRQLHGRNLTTQVRGIAKVVTAVANGDLKQKLIRGSEGRDRRTGRHHQRHDRHAGDFRRPGDHGGARGRHRRQARRPGPACRAPPEPGGTSPTTSTSSPANLTTQVRAIADVATAVTKGDLTRSITVEAQGEVAALKDNINEMIRNLKDTTHKNSEQDWLKTNLAKFCACCRARKTCDGRRA